jgi:hypothetical protein
MNNNNNRGQINIASDNASVNATQNKSAFIHANGQINKATDNATIYVALTDIGINMDELKENLGKLKMKLVEVEMYVEAGKIKEVMSIIDLIKFCHK